MYAGSLLVLEGALISLLPGALLRSFVLWVQRWGEFARLAYSSCFMKVAESWAFGMIVLLAGLLPDPDRSVASASITFNAYGITYMVFLAQSIAVSTRCSPLPAWLVRMLVSHVTRELPQKIAAYRMGSNEQANIFCL